MSIENTHPQTLNIEGKWTDLMFKNMYVDVDTRPEVIKLEYSLKLKIKRNDWLLADMCPQAVSHCALFGGCLYSRNQNVNLGCIVLNLHTLISS